MMSEVEALSLWPLLFART